MDNLEKEFINTAEFVQNWENGKQATNDEKLEAYKYYKQATIGDINYSKPTGIFNMVEKKKWEEWNSLKGVSQDNAKKIYADFVDNLQKKYTKKL